MKGINGDVNLLRNLRLLLATFLEPTGNTRSDKTHLYVIFNLYG
jgi:hypothetical protein